MTLYQQFRSAGASSFATLVEELPQWQKREPSKEILPRNATAITQKKNPPNLYRLC